MFRNACACLCDMAPVPIMPIRNVVSFPRRQSWLSKPLVEMLRDECIVVQLRIGTIHAINLFALALGQSFFWIKTPDAFKQTLAAQHLMNAGDAAGEAVGRVKESRVGFGDLLSEREVACSDGAVQLFCELEMRNRCFGPDSPVAQQAADDSCAVAAEIKFREQIDQDVVIVAGIKSDFVFAAGIEHGTDHVNSLIAIERRHFDGDDILDLDKFAPEAIRKDLSAGERLQIKADNRQNGSDSFSAIQMFVLSERLQTAHAEQRGIIAQ